MSISFNLIPVDLRTPGAYVEIDASSAYAGLSLVPTRVLLVGQRLAAGAVAAGTLVQLLDATEAARAFGRGSLLHRMAAAFKAANAWTEVWAIAADDDGAGVAAASVLTVSGTAAAAGTIALYIGGARVRVGVPAGADPTAIAVLIVAAVNADPDLIATAAAAAGTVTLTARNAGAFGNDIDVRHSYRSGEALPDGVELAVAPFAGGTANPEITPLLDALGDEWFTDIVCPWSDGANLDALETELADRFGPIRMLDGHGYVGGAGDFAALTALGASRNSPHLTIEGTGRSPTPPFERAAALAGVVAYHGSIDPARPFQTLTLPGVLAPAFADRPTLEERNLLLYSGVATTRVAPGGEVVIERVITTYRQTAFGAPDPSFLDLNTLKTLALLRYDVRSFITRKFPRHKLADDGTAFARGQAVVTPRLIKAELVGRFGLWESLGLVEGLDQFKRDLIVERDQSDPNRVNALIPPDVVNQLRVFAGLVQFRL